MEARGGGDKAALKYLEGRDHEKQGRPWNLGKFQVGMFLHLITHCFLTMLYFFLLKRDGDEGGGGKDMRVSKPQVQGHVLESKQLCKRVPDRGLPRRSLPGLAGPMLLHQALLMIYTSHVGCRRVFMAWNCDFEQVNCAYE
ncbi:hypothetical protein COCNU_scaffold018817G000010 [Cocos nucifera]|nr:hypothetical protein [Cocos nucifera]